MSETETRDAGRRLTETERETLYAPDRRMDAYYYSFNPTGAPAIDAILSAVAHAGKGYHSTENWSDEGDEDFPGRWGAGRSCIDVIQAAANEAAESTAELARLRAVVADYEHRISWDTTCENCARLLDSCSSDTARAERAEAEAARLRAVVEAVQAVADDWGVFAGIGDDFHEAINDSGAWRFARDLRAALAPVSSSGEACVDQQCPNRSVQHAHNGPYAVPLLSSSGEPESGERQVCPEHGIPDCSPLLNGCSRLTSPVSSSEGASADDDMLRFTDEEIEHAHAAMAEGEWQWFEWLLREKVRALAARPVLSREAVEADLAMSLLLYGEWLDGQGLIVGDSASGDDRSYEALALEFINGRDGGSHE